MGNKNNKNLKEIEVQRNTQEINEITKNIIFIEKTGIYLKFEYNKGLFRNKIKVIKFDSKYNDNLEMEYVNSGHYIFIDIKNFLKYYTALMNATNVLCSDKVRKTLDRKSLKRNSKILDKGVEEEEKDEDSDICPICEENKVNISLPCSHFFCENCIKIWMVKSETCPLCRFKLQKNETNPGGVKGSSLWCVVETVNKKEIDKENEQILLNLTENMFKSKFKK